MFLKSHLKESKDVAILSSHGTWAFHKRGAKAVNARSPYRLLVDGTWRSLLLADHNACARRWR